MALKLVTGPADLAVSLARVKQHLRVDSDDDDALIELYIKAATRQIDGPTYMGLALKPQTWDLIFDEWPSDGAIEIPLSPLISLDSVNHFGSDGLEVAIDAANYAVDTASVKPWVVPAASYSWPTLLDAINAVRVRFTAGHPDTADSPPVSTVPDNIQLAIMLMVGDAYAVRETVAEGGVGAVPMSVTVENLLHTSRIFR